jgi:hypothetical protein
MVSIRSFLGKNNVPGKTMKIFKGRALGATIVHRAILRLATRSVPGAILVGGGLLAKTLHDRRKSKKTRQQPVK